MSTYEPGGGQPEYLGQGKGGPGPARHDFPGSGDQGEDAPTDRGRRGVVAGVVVAVVAAVGVGGYGLLQLMAGGSSPATAVPADALGYVSLDLDPSASQKVEAFKTMRKFPSLRKDLHVGGQDDIRRTLFDSIVEDGDCPGLSYAHDVEPWIGNRIAVAELPDPERVAVPVVVVQVSDQAKAKKGIQALQACGSSGASADSVGIAFSGDYALVTSLQRDADAMAEDAETASLADDPGFKDWTERAGDPGIVTMYASKDVPGAIVRGMRHSISSDVSGFSPDEGFVRRERRYVEQMTDRVNKAFAGFEGAAGVVRFHDGAVEADFATKGLQDGLAGGDGAGRAATDLPSTTAMAMSVAVREGWLRRFLDLAGGTMFGPTTGDDDAMWSSAERATGLQLPEDIETLLGHGFAVSVDSSADLGALFSSDGPVPTPVGIRIQGDPDEILPIIDKLKKAAGPDADVVQVRRGDGEVAVALDADYATTLLEDGGLGDRRTFTDVVPAPDRFGGLFYVDFDAGSWLDRLVDSSGGTARTRADLAPLHAFGASAWTDEDHVRHASLRLTTD
jgi:hypothetical protein